MTKIKPNKIFICWDGRELAINGGVEVCATTAADARYIYAFQMRVPKSHVKSKYVRTLAKSA